MGRERSRGAHYQAGMARSLGPRRGASVQYRCIRPSGRSACRAQVLATLAIARPLSAHISCLVALVSLMRGTGSLLSHLSARCPTMCCSQRSSGTPCLRCDSGAICAAQVPIGSLLAQSSDPSRQERSHRAHRGPRRCLRRP